MNQNQLQNRSSAKPAILGSCKWELMDSSTWPLVTTKNLPSLLQVQTDSHWSPNNSNITYTITKLMKSDCLAIKWFNLHKAHTRKTHQVSQDDRTIPLGIALQVSFHAIGSMYSRVFICWVVLYDHILSWCINSVENTYFTNSSFFNPMFATTLICLFIIKTLLTNFAKRKKFEVND